MVINKKAVKASRQVTRQAQRRARRAIKASEEEEVEIEEQATVDVAPEASDLLFEAEDVAELIAEVTGQEVSVTADEETVTFGVGEEEFVVEAEGDEEILENTRRPLRGKAPVKASRRVAASRRVRSRR